MKRYLPQSPGMRFACSAVVFLVLAVMIAAIVLGATARKPQVVFGSFRRTTGPWDMQRTRSAPVAVQTLPSMAEFLVSNRNRYAIEFKDLKISVTARDFTTVPTTLISVEIANEALIEITVKARKVEGVLGVRVAKNPVWVTSMAASSLLCPDKVTPLEKVTQANLEHLAGLLNDAWNTTKAA
ncbi:hypothetical protein GGF32_008392 [Allomyces javanicus]|nr:hypothetical protein GGF32_008392 [Allomyces javanicus]